MQQEKSGMENNGEGLDSIRGIQYQDCQTMSYRFTPVVMEEVYNGVKAATTLSNCNGSNVCVCQYCGIGWYTDNIQMRCI